MTIAFRVLCAAALLIPTLAAADAPDQASDCGDGRNATSISYRAPMGQTFRPSQASLEAVELQLVGFNGEPPTGSVTVNVRDGDALDDTVLGTASITGYTIPYDHVEWVRFELSPAIAVVPDTTYMIEVVSADIAFGIGHEDCGYDRGAAVYGGPPADPVISDFAFRTYGPCGNGDLDSGEDCDDGTLDPDDCCSNLCEFETAGASCNGDGNDCTLEVCDGSAAACTIADGLAAEGAACSDGSPCTSDECDGAGVCVGTAAPVAVCATAAKASLGITDSDTAGKDKLKFKWSKGPIEVQHVEPLFNRGDASLCVYAGDDVLVSSVLPASDLWDGKGNEKVGNATYADKEGTIGGITSVGFKVFFVEPEKSQASWQTGGDNFTGPSMAGPVMEPVIAQIVTSAGGCYGAEFSGEQLKKNDGEKLKAVAK